MRTLDDDLYGWIELSNIFAISSDIWYFFQGTDSAERSLKRLAHPGTIGLGLTRKMIREAYCFFLKLNETKVFKWI